jgi:hypothetical protein
LADRDEVDDGVRALDRAPQARRVRHVSRHQLGADVLELRRPAAAADERAHRQLPLAQRPHDVRADEPRRAGDQNAHAGFRSKFCQ